MQIIRSTIANDIRLTVESVLGEVVTPEEEKHLWKLHGRKYYEGDDCPVVRDLLEAAGTYISDLSSAHSFLKSAEEKYSPALTKKRIDAISDFDRLSEIMDKGGVGRPPLIQRDVDFLSHAESMLTALQNYTQARKRTAEIFLNRTKVSRVTSIDPCQQLVQAYNAKESRLLKRYKKVLEKEINKANAFSQICEDLKGRLEPIMACAQRFSQPAQEGVARSKPDTTITIMFSPQRLATMIQSLDIPQEKVRRWNDMFLLQAEGCQVFSGVSIFPHCLMNCLSDVGRMAIESNPDAPLHTSTCEYLNHLSLALSNAMHGKMKPEDIDYIQRCPEEMRAVKSIVHGSHHIVNKDALETAIEEFAAMLEPAARMASQLASQSTRRHIRQP